MGSITSERTLWIVSPTCETSGLSRGQGTWPRSRRAATAEPPHAVKVPLHGEPRYRGSAHIRDRLGIALASVTRTIEGVRLYRGQHLPVNDMEDLIGNGSWEVPQSLDLDRLSALEARLLEQERAAIVDRPKDRIALALTVAGLGSAAGALLAAPLVMIVLSAACAFVLVGMNRRRPALANSIAFMASALVVFVFVPALDEMSQ